MSSTMGVKLRDGLLAYSAMEADRAESFGDYDFADARLVAMGYHPNVADSIVERLARRGWVEYGVSARSGWLTAEGRAALEEDRE